jgi:NAD(P)-dependent dehydrogenase (short-subunit alcohol dehydrogenase family)
LRLKDKVAVVTGGGSGIGEAIAIRFAEEGALVAVGDIDERNGERTAETITRMGRQAAYHRLDVSVEEDFERLFEAVDNDFGHVDAMVNNAGVGVAGSVAEQTESEWDLMMGVNAKGAFFGCKHAVRRMVPKGGGVIINIASVAGMVGVNNRAGYGASKMAIIGLTKSVAIDYAEHGVRANSISPGTIESPWIDKILADNPQPEEARRRMEQRQPLGRMGTPEEIAGMAVYLASAESAFMTGSNVVIDGGLTAR